MTLYYSLVFALLVAEMGIFVLLICPLPFTWRKMVFNFISNSPIIAKMQYGMKITFIFILILFIDSVNRVYRVQKEITDSAKGGQQQAVIGHERMEVQARKFYSQRNMYLCGFTLFLSLILNRTYTFILDILRLEQQLKTLRASSNESVKNGTYQQELEKKDKEILALKEQAEGLSREYHELSDRYNLLESGGVEDVPRKDL